MKDTLKNEALLKKVGQMNSLAEDDFNKFLTCAEPIHLSRGEYLLKEGQVCNHLYFVGSGCLHVSCNSERREATIGFALEGEFVSNIKSLKSQQPSRHTISANEKTLVFRFGKDRLMKLWDQSPVFETFLRRVLASMLIEKDERIDLLKLPTASERYHYLLKNNPELTRRVSITQLSSYLGVARETLSRIRSKRA